MGNDCEISKYTLMVHPSSERHHSKERALGSAATKDLVCPLGVTFRTS